MIKFKLDSENLRKLSTNDFDKVLLLVATFLFAAIAVEQLLVETRRLPRLAPPPLSLSPHPPLLLEPFSRD